MLGSMTAASTWPPEVPPFRPSRPEPAVPQPVQPIVPTWYEREVRTSGEDLADRLLDRRIVLATGPLDAALGERITAQLLLLDGRGAEPVQLHLAAPDGDLDAALALSDAVELLETPVDVTVRGTVGGPAVALLAVARERTAHRAATVVLREPHIEDQRPGRAEELGRRAEQHTRQLERFVDLLAARGPHEPAEVAADVRRGRVLSAAEAVAYGLVDHVR
jgi:ATP-dependent Clp protease protease subunit